MKLTAAILLFLFALMQVAPVASSLFNETCSVFVMSEEKGEEKTDANKKDKKDYTAFTRNSNFFSHKANIAFHLTEAIQISPCLEKLTPPPNFC